MAAYIEAHHPYAFAEMLGYVTDAVDLWPADRTATMFREWFDVRMVGPVFDLAGVPIKVTEAD